MLDNDPPTNSMGPLSSMNGIRQSLVSGIIIVLRRPARAAFGAFLFAISIVYLFFYKGLIDSATRVQQPSQSQLDEIPPQIWQISFGYTPLKEVEPALQTCIPNNQDYKYTLVSHQGVDEFARNHYAHPLEVLEPFLQLKINVLRSDLLRYMILELEGEI